MKWIELNIKNMRRIVIVAVYRPPQGDYKAACKLINDAILAADLKDNAEIFMLGDFNIDLKNKKSPASKELEAVAALWGMKAHITGVTRPTLADHDNLGGTCIDNIFSSSGHIAEAGILDWNFSDHLAVAIKRKMIRTKHKKVSFQGRSYRNYIMEDLLDILVTRNWETFYQSNDPIFCWNII